MDQKFEDKLRDELTIDRVKVSQLTDEALANRILTLTEVVSGYDSPDKEGEMYQQAIALLNGHPIENYRAVLRVLRKERRRRAMQPHKGLRVAPWTPFVRAAVPDMASFTTPEAWARYSALAEIDKNGRTAQDYHDLYVAAANDEIWVNSRYQVAVRRNYVDNGEGGLTEMVHLSIKRIDQQVVRDWRDLQRIKTELVGPECEGIELFPAESRMVDTANQYHIWCVNDPTFRWPVGWHEGRLMLDGEASEIAEAGQRPFEDA